MWVVWIIVSTTVVTALAVFISFAPAFRKATIGWKLLSLSGIPLAIAGLIFIVRFWEPTEGPYLANELYPYGDHLHAWAVSFGFTWLAFGLLFAGLALLGTRGESRIVWGALLGGWFICWLPHGVIGIAFAWAGQNAPSLQAYRKWGSETPGRILLVADALILLAHFGLSLAGFVITGIELRREHLKKSRDSASIEPPA